jgi:hypothetical protein
VRVGVTFSCPACRQLSPMSGVALEAGVLCVICGVCGEVVPVSTHAMGSSGVQPVDSGAVPSQRPKDPFKPPKDTCPKCIAPRFVTAGACRKCGLVFKHFSPRSVAPSKRLARGWSDLVLRWSDSVQHTTFQQLAVAEGELEGATRLYAIWLAHLPRDPWGLKAKDDLAMLATIAAASRQQRPSWVSRRVLLAVASLLILGGTLVARLS